VDIPRKRISLTLRLDDEAQPKQERERGPRQGGAGQNGGGQGGQRGGQGGGRAQQQRTPRPRNENPVSSTSNNAMADALRRAGLTR